MDNAYSRVLDRAQAGAHIMHFIRELTDQFTVDPQNMQTLFHLMNLGRLLDRMDGIAPSSLDLHLVAHAGPSPSETDGEDTNSGNVLRIANNSLILNGRHGLLPDYLTGPLREPQDILYGMLIFNQTHNLGTPVYREVLFMSLLAESSTTNRRNTTGDFCAANILDRTVPGAGTRHTFPNTTINDGNGTRVNPNIGIRPGSDSPRAGSRNTTDNLDSPFLESDLPRGGPTEYDKWDPNSDLPQNRGRLPPNVFIKLTNTTITRESGEANERSAGQEPTDWGSVAFVGTLAGATMILIGTSAATFTGDSMVQIGGGIVMTTGAVTGAIGAGFAATHLVIGAGAIELGQTLLSFTGTYGGFQAVSMGYALDAAIKAGIITAQEARYAVVVETLGNGMLIAIGTVDTYDAMKAAVAEPTAANIVSVIGNGVATVGGIMGGTPSAVRSMSSQFQVRLGLSEQTLDRLGMAGAGAAVGGLSLLGLNQLPSQQSRGPGSELKRIKTQVKQTWLNTGGLSGRGK